MLEKGGRLIIRVIRNSGLYNNRDHDLSHTLTKCCECLTITIKMLVASSVQTFMTAYVFDHTRQNTINLPFLSPLLISPLITNISVSYSFIHSRVF